MEQIISPGQFMQENDKSLITQGPKVVGAAIVGPTVKGNPMVPTVVTSYREYLSKFGDIFQSGSNYYEYFTSIAAKEWFSGGGKSLLVTKIVSGSSGYDTFAQSTVLNKNSTLASSSVALANALLNTGSFDISTGGNTYTFQITTASLVDTANTFYVSMAATTSSTATNVINKVNSKSVYVRTSASATGSLTSTIMFKSTVPGAVNTVVSGSALTNNTDVTSFIVESLGWGNSMNNSGSIILGSANTLVSGSSKNIRYEINYVDNTTGNFTLLVRRGDDSDTNKNVLETWSNLSLDEQLPNYIGRVIGDQKLTYSVTDQILQIAGNYPNSSQYIRIKPGSINKIPNSILPNGLFNTALSGSLPYTGSGNAYGALAGGLAATNLNGIFNENLTSTSTNCQGFTYSDYENALNLLSNKDEFEFKILLVPGATLGDGPLNQITDDVIALSENRADNISIIDATAYGQTPAAAITAAAASTSTYAAAYYPWVQTYSPNLGKAVWVPPSVVMGGVYAFNDEVGAPWFAPAGINRGGIGSVIRAERKLTQQNRDDLYSANINPLATFPSEGVVAFGQKTLQKRPTSLDRVNVRRLLIELKGFLGNTARKLVFDQNTQITRNRFLSVAEPYLESITQKQGLYAYKIIMDSSNNTSDVIDRNQLVGQIYIQPTRTAEFIILNFTLTPTGGSFD